MTRTIQTRYFASDPPAAIVAVINRTPDGEIFDWAAYIGGGATEDHRRSSDALGAYVARHGVKMYAEEVLQFFPGLPADKYRA